MHIQIIEFRLRDLDPEAYETMCDQLAPMFAGVAGLRAKIWLADCAGSRFGGVYVWQDRRAMESFAATDLSRTVAAHPNLAGITSRDFDVLEAPTRITRGALFAA